MSCEAARLTVTGVVQGVGFRPFVYREAINHQITGWVLNTVRGVIVHAEGQTDRVDSFIMALSENAPAAARVNEITIEEVPVEGFDHFEIRFSDEAEAQETTLVSPDLATCDACVQELFDPNNRRYHYPFINCTNCGPRFTIMCELPYDRAKTSMASFTMCADCEREYNDPADRRFHAQPDACFECGPHVGWALNSVDSPSSEDDISWAHDITASDAVFSQAAQLLRDGYIVAVKGLGGYHLACDASNEQAIATLRARKRREGKAFAVMVASIEQAKEYCFINDAEKRQLTLPSRPIVLLQKRPDACFAKGLADKLPELGVMLPSTPVQYLLLHEFGGMLVMTSGNIHDEPIVTNEHDAFEKLGTVADAFLVNDRAIEGRYDDSVLRVLNAGPAGAIVQFIRRARGYAPMPLAIPSNTDSDEFLAVGPEQKNTFTYTRAGKAFVSQHIGDMESVAVMDAWQETRQRYEQLFRLKPTHLVCDYHPEYLTSKWAHEQKTSLQQVQHHHAHILSVMGENNLEGPVCGFAFDGTGYGMDGAIWGGEVLLANLKTYERFANFTYMPLPGGAAAIKNPIRIAYGALWAFDLLDHPVAQEFVGKEVPDASVYEQMIERGINSPQTSSVGRLFDAASALLGICTKPKYEGEAAILLEACVHEYLTHPEEHGKKTSALPSCVTQAEFSASELEKRSETYTIEIIKNIATEQSTALDTSVILLDAAPVFRAMLDDMQAGVAVGYIAQCFHDAFVKAIVDVAELIRAVYDISTVALGGGVFMNRYLIERTLAQLQERGFTVALNKDLPPNDASVSYGQAVLGLQAQTKE